MIDTTGMSHEQLRAMVAELEVDRDYERERATEAERAMGQLAGRLRLAIIQVEGYGLRISELVHANLITARELEAEAHLTVEGANCWCSPRREQVLSKAEAATAAPTVLTVGKLEKAADALRKPPGMYRNAAGEWCRVVKRTRQGPD